jgi:hypothetical protein
MDISKQAFDGITQVQTETKKPPSASISNEIKTIAKQSVSGEQKKLIENINQYVNNKRFKEHLKGKINVNDLESLTVDELNEKLKEIDNILNTRGNQNMIDNGLKMGMIALENIVDGKTNLQVKGTTSACWMNDHFLDKLEQVKIKYGLNLVEHMQMDPLLELSLIVFQTGMMCHKRNTMLLNNTDTSVNLDEEI